MEGTREARLIPAVCPYCFEACITSWEGAAWQVAVDRIQEAVVYKHKPGRASGLLECSSGSCIASQAGMQSRPLGGDEVVEASLKEARAAEA